MAVKPRQLAFASVLSVPGMLPVKLYRSDAPMLLEEELEPKPDTAPLLEFIRLVVPLATLYPVPLPF
jgi:hypothetical protein